MSSNRKMIHRVRLVLYWLFTVISFSIGSCILIVLYRIFFRMGKAVPVLIKNLSSLKTLKKSFRVLICLEIVFKLFELRGMGDTIAVRCLET